MKLRIKYGLTKEGKFLSHLDMLRAWERAFRRACIPVAFSQGFNPHLKMSFGSALAVGITGSGEFMDIELEEFREIKEINEALSKSLPTAIEIYDLVEIEVAKASLMSVINRAKYSLEGYLTDEFSDLQAKTLINNFFAQKNLIVPTYTKKGYRDKNIREGVFDLSLQFNAINNSVVMEFTVLTGSQGNIRPEEVMRALVDLGLPINIDLINYHREGLYIDRDGELKSPLS